MEYKKCAVCNKQIIPRNKHGGRKKIRPVCDAQSCNNKWTYRQRLDYYSEKHRKKYWVLKENRYEYLRAINKRAKSVQRYGVKDREEFIKNRGGKCDNCESDKYLRIHHIDNRGRKVEEVGEKPNNSNKNLMVVCQSCHLSHHRYGLELKMKTKSDTPSNRREQ